MENSLQLFFNDLARYPLLSPEEERKLLKEIKNGNKEAKDKMICSNVRLVLPVAKTYQNCGIEFEDLISYGIMGLIHAIDKFEIEKNNKFSTYCVYWIRQYISRALNNYGRTIRIPVYIMEIINKLRKIERDLNVSLERTPTIKEIAEAINLPENKVIEYKKYFEQIESLDKPVDENDNTIGSFIEDNYFINPLTNYIEQDKNNILIDIINTLPEREASIIKYEFGLNNGEQKSIDEIADMYGITKERIRQLENKALRKLRAPTRAKILKQYMI